MQYRYRLVLLFMAIFIAGCSTTPPPRQPSNICSIFRQYPQWYWDTQGVKRRWGVPIAVQMAIIHQESAFKGKALPARTKLLWIIPWTRPSSAYGYTQALKQTWKRYKRENGRVWVSRTDFGDAVDFIGWYVNTAHRRVGISKYDAYNIYLAYHEGMGGFKRKTYLRKRWLVSVAQKVKRRAIRYQAQLRRCQRSLPSKPWYKIW